MLLPGVPALTVPHSRLQAEGCSVSAMLIVERINAVHAVAPNDWTGAHEWTAGASGRTATPDSDGAPNTLPDLSGLASLHIPSA